MMHTPSILPRLLADCDARGIRLALADGGDLEIDAPQDELTPDLLARLKAHKTDLLEMLRPAPEVVAINQGDAAVVWRAALDRLEGDPLFPPEVIGDLRVAEVRWDFEPDVRPAPPAATSDSPAKPICRCGSMTWRDVSIHGGESVRRDCDQCGRFLDFPVWNSKNTLRNEQHRVGC